MPDPRGLSGPPDPFYDTFVLPLAGRAVVAAIGLGIFDSLAAEPARAGELAERLGLDPAGAAALCEALVSLGYLRLERDRLHVADGVAPLVTRGSESSIATFAGDFARSHWRSLDSLEGALRGEPSAWHDRPPDDELWEPYIRGLYELSREEHDANAAVVGAVEPRTMLDLAGGHGAFAMAMCRRHRGLGATVVDLPAAAGVGRAIVEEQGFADRVSFLEGDLFELDLGTGADVVSAFNLLHHLPPERALDLIRRARRALASGGLLVIGDTERPPPGEPVSQVGALTGLAFFAESRARTYALAEIEGWLRDAGFATIRTHRNDRSPWRVVIVAAAPE